MSHHGAFRCQGPGPLLPHSSPPVSREATYHCSPPETRTPPSRLSAPARVCRPTLQATAPVRFTAQPPAGRCSRCFPHSRLPGQARRRPSSPQPSRNLGLGVHLGHSTQPPRLSRRLLLKPAPAPGEASASPRRPGLTPGTRTHSPTSLASCLPAEPACYSLSPPQCLGPTSKRALNPLSLPGASAP